MNWDLLFPPSRSPGIAGSCSDGGPGERPALYQSLWTRLLSAFYRPAPPLPCPREEGRSRDLGRASGLLAPLLDKKRGEAAAPPLWAAAWAGATGEAPPKSLLGPALQPGLPQLLELPGWTSGRPGAALQQKLASVQCGLGSIRANLPLSATHTMEKAREPSYCFGEMGLIILDQDYGYSSLEEEHIGSQHLGHWGNRLPPQPVPSIDRVTQGVDPKDNTDTCVQNEEAVLLHLSVDPAMPEIEDGSTSLQDDEWSSNEDSSDESEDDAGEEDDYYSLPRPQCSNKTIAYILGSNPSSSDDSEEDEDSDSDDDGFDSDGSSELSDTDEELLNSLTGTSDPYNLMNFQACFKTQQNVDTRTAFESSCPQQSVLCTLVLDDDDSDRLDSGFSDEVQGELQKTLAQLASGKKCSKKVAFDEEVTVHYVSSEEIRRGPWEEYARDRCRFQKRIRETEDSIAYCFTPQHRWTVLAKMQLGS
ncbi:protein phosphatase 1 regulatory subunit 15B isoform X1 [Scyliorhinus torazame]|uniref:protein phosphatase 1 regulatory subunit 15B isoform X1 n=1 Tax=Scyliorhinus torazame TaxID=75743 RepID=UPI003B5C90AC